MPVLLRPDFDPVHLRVLAKGSKNASQARRLLALAAIYKRRDTDRGRVDRQIVRGWVLKFNAHGPDEPIDRKPPGQPSRLDDTHRAALVGTIEGGPTPAIHGMVRWRLIDLCQWLWHEFGVFAAKPTLSRELRAMRYHKLTARPPRMSSIRHRPNIFGAICPKDGKTAGLILPWCIIKATTLFLAELSTKVTPGRHALLLLDRASWHRSAHLVVPDNITIVALPAKCPELNHRAAIPRGAGREAD